MSIIDQFIKKSITNPKTIVFPESDDERVLRAVEQIHNQNIARPILIGKAETILKFAQEMGIKLDHLPIIFPTESEYFLSFIKAYIRKRPNINEKIAEKLLRKPLFFAGMMVSEGRADGMVAGVSQATSTVIQAASLTIGFDHGLSNPSSFFIMVLPEFNGVRDHILIFADCAVNIQPTPKQLAEIAVITGRNAKKLLDIEPKIALLSFSTKGSARHADTEKVIQATQIAREIAPDLDIDGELQADAAIISSVAQKKVKQSAVAGKSNVLIFPDLDSGNIAYKLVQYLGKAQAYGPFLQGFAKPVSDLSRGASVEDIVGVTAVTVVQAQ